MNGIIEAGYFLATISFIGGLKFLSSPLRAKTGNLLAAVGMVLAVALTFYAAVIDQMPSANIMVILVAIAIGTVMGRVMSERVQMTGMPQLVSLFNAMGGGCAMLLGIIEARLEGVENMDPGIQMLLCAGLVIGAASFTGSIVAYYKLDGKLKDRKTKLVIYSARISLLIILLLFVSFSLGVLPINFVSFVYILAVLGLVYGILFVMPIGGATIPLCVCP